MNESMVADVFASIITPDLYVFIAAVYGICFALKKAAFFDDRFIPLAAVVLGIALEITYVLGSSGNIVEAICKGVVIGMAAVYLANIIKQMGANK